MTVPAEQIILLNQLRDRVERLETLASPELIWPGGSCGGNLVNCTARNVVDADDPASVFADAGAILADGTGEQRCYLHFARPISLAALRMVITTGAPTLTFNMDSPDDGGDLASFSLGTSLGIVTAEWDPTTLTWNNKPATTITNFGFAMNLGMGDTLASNLPANDIDFDITGFVASLYVSPGQDGTAYGFAVNLTHSTQGTAHNSVQATMECKIFGTPDPDSISFGNSSFGIYI